MKDIKTLRRVSWFGVAFEPVRGISFKLSSRAVVKMAIARASRGSGMSFTSSMKTEIVHRGIVVLAGFHFHCL